MKARRTAAIAVTAAALAATAACGSDNGAATTAAAGCPSGTLSGAGSTFQQNAQQQWISDYRQRCSGAQINYQATGSGAGIQQFAAGTIDYAGTDVTLKAEERRAAEARCGGPVVHLPVAAGGVALLYNLPGVENLQLSAPTLARIFTGQIKRWNDPAIAADNPGVTLPDIPVTAFHRSDGSGTTAVLSEYLASQAGAEWTLGTGKEIQWPSGQGARGSDGVTAGVKATSGGITYAETSFAQGNQLPVARVKNAQGTFAEPSGANVSAALASGLTLNSEGNDRAGTVDFAKMAGYPITTVTYVVACERYADAGKRGVLKNYLDYVLTDGQQGLEQLGFAPLPEAVSTQVKTSVAAIS